MTDYCPIVSDGVAAIAVANMLGGMATAVLQGDSNITGMLEECIIGDPLLYDLWDRQIS